MGALTAGRSRWGVAGEKSRGGQGEEWLRKLWLECKMEINKNIIL